MKTSKVALFTKSGLFSAPTGTLEAASSAITLLWILASLSHLFLGTPALVFLSMIGRVALALRIVVFAFRIIRVKASDSQMSFLRALEVASPPLLVSFARLEARIYKNFWLSLRATPPEVLGFSHCRGADYKTLIYLLIFASLVELPVLLVVSYHLVNSPEMRWIHFLTAGATAYSFIFLRADWFVAMSRPHRLSNAYLYFNSGIKISGKVAWQDIIDVKILNREERIQVVKNLELKKRVFAHTIDRPNILIFCKSGSVVSEHLFFGSMVGDELALYVDRPSEMAERLRSNVGA